MPMSTLVSLGVNPTTQATPPRLSPTPPTKQTPSLTMLPRPRTPVRPFSLRGRGRSRDGRPATPDPAARKAPPRAPSPASDTLARLLRREPASAEPEQPRAYTGWQASKAAPNPGAAATECNRDGQERFEDGGYGDGGGAAFRDGGREDGSQSLPAEAFRGGISAGRGPYGGAVAPKTPSVSSGVSVEGAADAPVDDVSAETASLSSSSLRLPAARRGRPPAQLHVEALGLPSAYSSHVYARLTLHGDTLAVTEQFSSQNPMFAKPFFISPPHGALETRRGRDGAASEPASAPMRSSRAAAALDLDRIYVVHLHCHACGDVPFASVPLPLREVADAPGQRFLIPIFEPGSSLLLSSSVTSVGGDTGGHSSGADGEEPAQLALTYEPLVPGGEVLVADRRFCLNVRVSALKRRGKVLNSRVPLVIAVYRKTAPAPPVKPRWVLISLTPPSSKPQHNTRYVQTPPQDIPYVHACNGDLHRQLRITLYHIDSAGRFRVIGYHQTTVADLEKAAIVGGQPQTLQGRYLDDRVGTLRIVAAPDKDESSLLRVMVQVDLASTKHLVSATYRPSAHSAAAAQVAAAARAAAREPLAHVVAERELSSVQNNDMLAAQSSFSADPKSAPNFTSARGVIPSHDASEPSARPMPAARPARLQSAEWRVRSASPRLASPSPARAASPSPASSLARPASPGLSPSPQIAPLRSKPLVPIPAPLPPSGFSDGRGRTRSGGSASGVSIAGSNDSGNASSGLVDVGNGGSGRLQGWADRERTSRTARL